MPFQAVTLRSRLKALPCNSFSIHPKTVANGRVTISSQISKFNQPYTYNVAELPTFYLSFHINAYKISIIRPSSRLAFEKIRDIRISSYVLKYIGRKKKSKSFANLVTKIFEMLK